MKFNRISLRDFRAIRFLNFEPRPAGITIIEGDNEVGKSSIAEALWLIFEQHDDSSSQLIRSIRPADRDAATEIEVEISTGEYRFTYFKRFHRSPRTELTVHEPKREHLAGREADNRAKQIIEATMDRELWSALRVQQGLSLEVIAPGQHQSLLGALEVAAGQVLGGDREQSLYERMQDEYERYFTSTGRERASGDGPNAPRLRAARDAAMDEATRLSGRISALDDRAIKVAELERAMVALATRQQVASAAVADLQQADAGRRQQQSVVDTLTAKARLQEASLQASKAAHQTRQRAIEAMAPRRIELQDLASRLQALSIPLEQAAAKRAQAAESLERAIEAATVAATAREAAEARLHLASADFTVQTMTERLERLERHEPELTALVAWLAACAVDRPLMNQMEEASSRADQVRARRDAEGASIELAAAEALDFEINGKPVRIEPGTSRRGTVLGESVIALPGGITITVRAGAGAREAASQAAVADSVLEALLGQAGAGSVATARDLMHERIEKEERRRNLEQQLKADLRDLGSAEELRQKLGRERARIAALRHSSGEDTLTIDAAKAALDAAARAATAAEVESRACRTNLTQAESDFLLLSRERDQLAERLDGLRTQIDGLEADLAARRAEQPDATIEEELRALGGSLTATAASLAEASTLLTQMPNCSAELAQATAERAHIDAESARLSLEAASHRGVLEDAGAEGLHSQLSEAEQMLDGTQAELDAFVRRAAAARILFETMRTHRDRARENYAEPLREKIDAFGRLIFGPTFGVELSDDLRVIKRTLNGLTLEVAQLSVGVREQIAIVTRLACASLVSASGGAPLVLDDVLGWADPGRLRKFGPLLAEAAGQTQVLIFTCTPERFASVVPARVISLPSGQVNDRIAAGSVRHELVSSPSTTRPSQPARRPSEPSPAPQATFDLFAESETAAARS